jgi:WXG100 family type VII secretion target
MTQPSLQIDPGTLTKLISNVDATQAQLASAQTTIAMSAADVSSAWTGTAATAYRGALEEWGTDASTVAKGLTALREALQGFLTAMSSAEESAQAQARS